MCNKYVQDKLVSRKSCKKSGKIPNYQQEIYIYKVSQFIFLQIKFYSSMYFVNRTKKLFLMTSEPNF